ncbi:MAG: RsmB/NOP family class I SAM-dependent RNA methyltransferase [Proteocatella sp.]
MQNLPDIFLKEMKSLLGSEYDEFIKTYDEPKYSGLRINNLKISNEEFEGVYKSKLSEMMLFSIPWCPSGYYYNDATRPAKSPYYNAGLYYIQEPSAMSPVEYLDIHENMKVLDLCSAPGGKTTQIASKLNNTGILVSNDISNQRIKAVLRNVEMQGISNALISSTSPQKLASRFEEYFDRILLDVPCSGEGMFRKDPDLIKTYDNSRKENPDMQKTILPYAADMLKIGGLMMYSTCTFNLEENEKQLLEFLENNQNFKAIKIPASHGFVEGYGLTESARLFPHKINGEGHFLCLLQKKSEKLKSIKDPDNAQTDAPEKLSSKNIKDKISLKSKYLDRKSLPQEYLDFEKNEMNIEIEGEFIVENGKIYKELDLKIELKGIKIVRNGLYIGEIKGKSFSPSSAFIMAMKKSDFKNTMDLESDDDNLIKYLKCETIFVDNKDGFTIICVDGHPLGYGKVKDGTLKNYYNKNWRIL